jgi:preprotein translocase subunit Sec63
VTSEILEAAKLFEIGQRASIEEINGKYRELLLKWHPDHCNDKILAKEMTMKIIDSYKILIRYCQSVKISFTEKNISQHLTKEDPEEFWNKKFGHDPLWGYSGQ